MKFAQKLDKQQTKHASEKRKSNNEEKIGSAAHGPVERAWLRPPPLSAQMAHSARLASDRKRPSSAACHASSSQPARALTACS